MNVIEVEIRHRKHRGDERLEAVEEGRRVLLTIDARKVSINDITGAILRLLLDGPL